MKLLPNTFAAAGIAIALSGCATTPAEPQSWLADTRWAVVDVNGVNVADRTDFRVSFSNSRFEGVFGCRRVSGQYTLRPASNGDPQPIYVGQGARFSGEACTGSMAEELAPELLANATFSLSLLPDGRLVMLQPPTGIALRPL